VKTLALPVDLLSVLPQGPDVFIECWLAHGVAGWANQHQPRSQGL